MTLEDHVGMNGTCTLAIGYAMLLWPDFKLVRDYILMADGAGGAPDLGETLPLEGFEQQPGATAAGVEWVMNHRHLADLHMERKAEPTPDKLLLLGTMLSDMWSAKLARDFPDRPCRVEFSVPDDAQDLWEYQISFWQIANEGRPAG